MTLKDLNETPLSMILLIVGFVSLSVGYGAKLAILINVDQINKTYAKIIGAVFLVFGLVGYVWKQDWTEVFPTGATDPFLVYYLASVPIVVSLYWAVLKFTSGEMQIRAAKHSFLFVGVVVTVAVLWRAMDVYSYLGASDRKYNLPLGLYERHNYLPYLVLLAAGIMASIWGIYVNTREQPNIANRPRIFQYFIWSCVYLAVCGLAWEAIDFFARSKIPN